MTVAEIKARNMIKEMIVEYSGTPEQSGAIPDI